MFGGIIMGRDSSHIEKRIIEKTCNILKNMEKRCVLNSYENDFRIYIERYIEYKDICEIVRQRYKEMLSCKTDNEEYNTIHKCYKTLREYRNMLQDELNELASKINL